MIMAVLLAGIPRPSLRPPLAHANRRPALGMPRHSRHNATHPRAAIPRSAPLAGTSANAVLGSLEEVGHEHASSARKHASSAGESRGALAETGTVAAAPAYVEALRRAPTPAERAHWEGFLSAGNPHGAMLEALVAGDAKD